MSFNQTVSCISHKNNAHNKRQAPCLKLVLSLFAASVLATTSAQAEDILYSDELIDRLDISEPRNMPRTRGMIKVPGASPTHSNATPSVQGQSARSVILNIVFEFNSSNLSSESIKQLNELGKALDSQELGGFQFEIAGHTDASGSSSYNRELSFRRAESVKQHLYMQLGIDPDRLYTKGWGEDRPISMNDPYHPDNRRVEIINLGYSK